MAPIGCCGERYTGAGVVLTPDAQREQQGSKRAMQPTLAMDANADPDCLIRRPTSDQKPSWQRSGSGHIPFGSLCALLFFSLLTAAPATADRPAARNVDTQTTAPAKEASQGAVGEQGLALVIGNSAYTHIARLDNPSNDARDMCAALRTLGFRATCHLDLPTRRELKKAITDYTGQLRKGGVAVIYYAGHGIQERGENFIIPTDAMLKQAADIEDEALPLSYVMRLLEESRSGLNVVVLDACRDNPMRQHRGVSTGGLAPVEAPPGTIVVYATAPGRVALDGKQGSNGIFTAELLKYIKQPGLTVEEMVKRVTLAVQLEARSRFGIEQVPWINSSFTGRFCFAGCEDPQLVRELEVTRKAKQALEQKAQEYEKRQVEREKRLTALESEVEMQRRELERRAKALVLPDSPSSARPAHEVEAELAKVQGQLQLLEKKNVALADQALRLQRERDELQSLKLKIAELERRAAEIDSAKKNLVTTPGAPSRPSAPGSERIHLPPSF